MIIQPTVGAEISVTTLVIRILARGHNQQIIYQIEQSA
jgi:hypothetical protein